MTEPEIFAAALVLIQANGVDALSMRALAQRLGVSPMAVYYYLPNKEALLTSVAESLLATLPTPEPMPEAWDAQLRDHALLLWERLSAYPGLSRFVIDRTPMKAFSRLNLYVLSLLRAGGFHDQSAMLAVLSFNTYLGGMLSTQAGIAGAPKRKQKPKAKTRRSKPPPDARALLDQMKQVTARAWIEFGIDTVIAGLRAQRAQQLSAAAARTQSHVRTRAN